ncbi:(2Fe-2S)-binding protein [Lujinxingia litoralis]|uniref:(2Fe-2S)-binding protein n=1 Tax=Lujinxingia litoralis TaxID=2211119 RepID=A0A328C428_9DELT|nr:Rieske 2Fe-2S domain-containing protein [Lujinxingia litoralis]RAL20699.1 (2Fe-2S)-binding protein [Lujinxingia litoralis]
MPTSRSSTLAILDICDLRHPGDARAFLFTDAHGRPATGFLLRLSPSTLVAFENRCPHWNIPLGDDPSRLFHPAGNVIVCQTHGARFDAHSGLCQTGPCDGQHLTRFTVLPGPEPGQVTIKRSGLSL